MHTIQPLFFLGTLCCSHTKKACLCEGNKCFVLRKCNTLLIGWLKVVWLQCAPYNVYIIYCNQSIAIKIVLGMLFLIHTQKWSLESNVRDLQSTCYSQSVVLLFVIGTLNIYYICINNLINTYILQCPIRESKDKRKNCNSNNNMLSNFNYYKLL